jgi:alkenylglycerophosphocholine/alkenylglycerophosphoethanolamine hydrolase
MRRPAGVRDPRLEAVLAGIFTAAVVLYLGGFGTGPARLALKPVPVIALAAWVSPRNRTLLGRLVTAGLLLSALGDVLLEAGRFLPGLVAFLAAHVAYLVAFVSDERRLRLARLLPFAAWTAGAFGLLCPGLGEMTVPVALYIGVITLMMWRASARLGSPTVSPIAARLGLAGAIAFGASDTLLAFDRFLQPISGVHFAILALYWLAQCGIAASAALGAREAR